MSESVLAIDIGGTTIRGTKADPSGLIGEPWEYPTGSIDSLDDLIDRLKNNYSDIDAIGVAAAGVVDRENKELVNLLAEAFDVPLALENDGDAGALGIMNYGDTGKVSNFGYLTLSTGIGSGIIHNDQLIPGVEAGFLNLGWDGSVRHAEVNNPWEGYASGDTFPDRVREWLADETRNTDLTGEENAKEFFETVYQGDQVAREYYTTLKKINAAGIGTLTDLFATDLIRIGGGVAHAHPNLVNYRNDQYTDERIDISDYCVTKAPDIELTELGDTIELYGAAAAALKEIN
jgi:glucokinase